MKTTTKKVFVLLAGLALLGRAWGLVKDLEVEGLRYASDTKKLATISKLVKEKNKVYLPAMAELLNDPSKEIRSAACQGLLEIGDATCTPYFAKALEDKWWQVRLYGVKGLVKHGEGEIVPYLEEALNDSYWQVRYYAAVGLGKFGDAEALQPLLDHLKDTNVRVVEEILWALNRLMWRDKARARFKELPEAALTPLWAKLSSRETGLRIRTVWFLESTGDERMVPALMKALDDENPEVTIRALWALENLKADQARYAIESKLEDPRVKIKIESIKTLVRLHTQDTINGLVANLNASDENVRIYALWALERINDPVTYAEITRCLTSPSDRTQEYATKIIENIKSPEFYPFLEELAASEEAVLEHRLLALQILGRIGNENVKNFLLETTRSENPALRNQALQSFFGIDKLDVGFLRRLCYLENYDSADSVRKQASQLLAGVLSTLAGQLASPDRQARQSALEKTEYLLEAKSLRPLLRQMARNEYPEVREQMANLAGKMPQAAASADLREIFQEPNTTARKAAAYALGEIRDRSAVPLLKTQMSSGDPELQVECGLALAKLGYPEAAAVARKYLRSTDGQLQKKSVEIFAYLQDRESTGHLLRMLEDSELELKMLSAWALARMGEPQGLEVLVKLSEQNVEPVRTQANRYLSDPAVPFKERIPGLREEVYRKRVGVREVSLKIAKAFRTSGPVQIDGQAQDRFWRTVQENNQFLLLGPERVESPYQTRVSLGYDDQNLYLLFICDDPRASQLTMNNRDFITVSVNPRNSAQEWYQFVVHPHNHIRYSYVWKYYQNDDQARAWNSAWKCSTSIQSSKWIAEMAIPLADCKAGTARPGTEWNINFSRESEQVPATTWTGRMENPEQFGVLVFGEQP